MRQSQSSQSLNPNTQFGHGSISPFASVSEVTLPDEIRESLYADPSTSSVPIFNHAGSINAEVRGVSTLQFNRLTWYYSLLKLPWKYMLGLSFALYITVVTLFTVLYYTMCHLCGANVSIVSALYFVIVSISANGGYMGEDQNVMYPGHRCFAHRTYLIMFASYISILLGAMIATVFIAKASTHEKLQHRVVFSDYVTLNMLSMDTFRMSFRVSSIAERPMVHGSMRLYLVSMVAGASTRQKKTERQLAEERKRHAALKPHMRRQSILDISPALHPGHLTTGKEGGGTPPWRHHSAPAGALLHHDSSAREITVPIPPPDVEVENPSAAAPLTKKNSSSNNYGTLQESEDFPGGDSEGKVQNHSLVFGKEMLPPIGDSQAAARRMSLGDAGAGDNGEDGHSYYTDTAPIRLRPADEDDEDEVPLSVRIEELPWACDEEIPLPGCQGDLNLWFPATINHIIDVDSPLYYVITGKPRPTQGGLYHAGHRHFMHSNDVPHRSHAAAAAAAGNLGSTGKGKRGDMGASLQSNIGQQSFQIVAVFEATDSATSTIIQSKHVYTPDNLIAHYHFAAETLMSQKRAKEDVNHHGIQVAAKETTIDYCRFNELIPDEEDDDDDE